MRVVRRLGIFAVLSIAACAPSEMDLCVGSAANPSSSSHEDWIKPWVETVPMYDASDPPPIASRFDSQNCPQCWEATRFSHPGFSNGFGSRHWR
jgi:hypothetical protein